MRKCGSESQSRERLDSPAGPGAGPGAPSVLNGYDWWFSWMLCELQEVEPPLTSLNLVPEHSSSCPRTLSTWKCDEYI